MKVIEIKEFSFGYRLKVKMYLLFFIPIKRTYFIWDNIVWGDYGNRGLERITNSDLIEELKNQLKTWMKKG